MTLMKLSISWFIYVPVLSYDLEQGIITAPGARVRVQRSAVPPPHGKKPAEVVQTSHQDASERILGKIFQARLIWRSPEGRPRAGWRDYLSAGFGIPQ